MSKRLTILLICLITNHLGLGQRATDDLVRDEISQTIIDADRAISLIYAGQKHMFSRPDSAIIYGTQALHFTRDVDAPLYTLRALTILARAFRSLGNDTKSLQVILKGLALAETHHLTGDIPTFLMQSGDIYAKAGQFDKSLEVLQKARIIFDSLSALGMSANTQNYIGEAYLLMGNLDSAAYYFQSVYNFREDQIANELLSKCLVNLGKIEAAKGNNSAALCYYVQAIQDVNDAPSLFISFLETARLYQTIGKIDSAIFFGQEAFNVASANGLIKDALEASELISNIYVSLNYEKAYEYGNIASSYKDSLFAMSNIAAFEGFTEFDKRERQLELDAMQAAFQSKIRLNIFLGSSFTLIVVLVLIYRNSRQNKRNKEKIESAYIQLQSTQSQLIQSEKMASLGELTAGIAHEIQNPLNFVNNFSEVSKELIEEMEAERLKVKGERDEGLEEEILKDLNQNLEKIRHHGQRASGIVKGMLEHSRIGDGKKELTDLNALADEYLRLAYHGLRAKDKSFNADFKTEFDPYLPKINIVPQDIGRVLLNLINNAFYVVSTKSKAESSDYQPKVLVSTKLSPLEGGVKGLSAGQAGVKISIKDNGPGIPAEIKNKIFQPFFTTKPTGQGTGLGLSLSYDIIKAHGGEISVESQIEQGTEFIIHLPVV